LTHGHSPQIDGFPVSPLSRLPVESGFIPILTGSTGTPATCFLDLEFRIHLYAWYILTVYQQQGIDLSQNN